jgi:hypothetical protein
MSAEQVTRQNIDALLCQASWHVYSTGSADVRLLSGSGQISLIGRLSTLAMGRSGLRLAFDPPFVVLQGTL